MRAYIAYNMEENEDLLTSLETMKSENAATRKLVEEGVGLLRKVEGEKEAIQVEARWLAEKKEVMAADKKKTEEEAAPLRQKQ